MNNLDICNKYNTNPRKCFNFFYDVYMVEFELCLCRFVPHKKIYIIVK